MLCWCVLRILLAVQQELDALPGKRIEVSHCELLGWSCKMMQICRNFCSCDGLNNWRSETTPHLHEDFGFLRDL